MASRSPERRISETRLPCPPESGPSASDLRTSNDRIVSSKHDVLHKGTFHLHAPFSSTSIAQSSIHSRTSFPGPLSIRRFRSRELFVSRFRCRVGGGAH